MGVRFCEPFPSRLPSSAWLQSAPVWSQGGRRRRWMGSNCRPGIQSGYQSKNHFHLPRRAYVFVRTSFQALSLTPGFAACLRGKGEPITLSNELLCGSSESQLFLTGPFFFIFFSEIPRAAVSLQEPALSKKCRAFFPRVQTWLMGEKSTSMKKFRL